MVETEPGAYSILVDGKSYEARVSGDAMVVNGHRFEFEIDDPRPWRRAGGAAGYAGPGIDHGPDAGKSGSRFWPQRARRWRRGRGSWWWKR